MVSELFDFIDHTARVADVPELTKHFLHALRAEGYENAVFARAKNRRLASLPWHHLPQGYAESYQSRGWDKIDPVMQSIHTARRPFRWSDAGQGGLTSEQRRFFDECREFGVHSGVTIPLHGPGLEVDLISLSLRHAQSGPSRSLGYVYGLSTQYWFRYCELTDVRFSEPVYLTPKELECLRWCKEGKTNWEISEILYISEKTVEFHLTNIIRKMGTNNRISAVVIALQKGLIAL